MKLQSLRYPFLVGLWLLAAGGSYFFLLQYKGSPGAVGNPSELWPRESLLQPDSDRPTLVMLAHPRCPCTAASLEELADFLSHHPKRVAAHVLFIHPESVPDSLHQESLWNRAAAIPEVTVSTDPMGREAKKFGAATSGHVLLYDRHGRLLFSGGITAARGHTGANLGLDRLGALLECAQTAPATVPVFGCPLESPLPAPDKETQ